MKERPILFSGAMVNAILNNKKRMTRRVVKPQPTNRSRPCYWVDSGFAHSRDDGGCTCREIKSPYGQPGDLLWVRETFWPVGDFCYQSPAAKRCETGIRYAADNALMWRECGQQYRIDYKNPQHWRPSIHMPRWASRLSLRVTEARVERLQDISEADAIAEGIDSDGIMSPDYLHPDRLWSQTPISSFMTLWDSINAYRGYAWDSNPWVWVIGFERVEATK